MQTINQENTIFRFKFSDEFLPHLVRFSTIHQYDEPKVFREAYDEFIDNNREIVNKEIETLHNNGYQGNVNDKMYRSARYYFKNRDNSVSDEDRLKDKKERRKYIPRDAEFIKVINIHATKMVHEKVKPATSFTNFTTSNNEAYENEYQRVFSILEDKKETIAKIKKTYKNRYFIIQKKYKNKN